ncbi:MAG: RidA family protein [Rhodospirillales bacterium]
MLKTATKTVAAAFALSLLASAASAQTAGAFEKKHYNYNEWAKGRFAEVVTVKNPGTWIFLGGIGPEQEGDGKIVHKGDFYQQCKYAFMKIKKLLDAHGATLRDVAKTTVYMTDIRHFAEWGKCRSEEMAGFNADVPASTLLNVSQLAWPDMLVEIDVIAVTAK